MVIIERTSLKFKNMSKNTTDLIYAMLTNRNLVKYIHYIGDFDPLDVSLPNVKASDVKANNFVMTHFNTKVLTEAKIILFFRPIRSKFPSGKVTSIDQYAIDIIIPYDYLVIGDTGDLRGAEISYEICQAVDLKNIAGIGNVEVTEGDSYKVNDQFEGWRLFLNVTNGTMNSGV